MATTRKPSGVSIARNGLDFDVSWKVMDNDHGGGQECRFRNNVMKADKYWYAEITTSDTNATAVLAASSYYPTAGKPILTSLTAQIRGKRAPTTTGAGNNATTTTYGWSDWTEKTFAILPPRAPIVSSELFGTYPTCKYSWSVETADDDHRPFTKIEWQSIRTSVSADEADPKKLYWGSISGNANDWRTSTSLSDSDYITIQEQSDDLSKRPYVRWVRFRALGPGGASDWRYTKHVYAKPYAAVIDKDTRKTFAQNGAGGTTKIRVEWTAARTHSHPIDEVQVKYCIDTPDEYLALPSSPDWEDAITIADSTGTDVAEFSIDSRLSLDTCLWVRVDTVHDSNISQSRVVLVQCGELSAPAFNGTISVNTTDNTASVSITRNSAVPDSRTALYFHYGNNKPFVCAVFGKNEYEKPAVHLPYISGTTDYSFSLMEFQGTIKDPVQTRTYTIGGTDYTYYRYVLDTNMESDVVDYGGDVPKAPTYVTAKYVTGATQSASKSNANPDTAEVLVDWYWAWAGATAAEVSWSQDPHAWDSVHEPDTYVVDRIRSSQIYISKLERGRRWYFRVRLIRETDDVTVYGPYCKTVSVNIAEQPQAPETGSAEPATVVAPEAMAAASKSLTRKNSEFTLRWQYVNTDGTYQRAAEVREVTLTWNSTLGQYTIAPIMYNNAPVIRGQVNGYTKYIKFTPADFRNPRWASGETHYLQVRVTSTAGLQSEWSNPVAITVADAITCTIDSVSFDTTGGHTHLTELPLTATITGAGEGGITSLVIERAYDYNIIRPDETDFHGCAGETIVSVSHRGEDAFSVGLDDLVGTLDDKAYYKLTARTEDDFGQYAMKTVFFRVMWDHQPAKPTATVTVSDGQALITPSCVNAAEGDFFDVYRLSADRPELIVANGQWGETYSDPYPTIGEHGGYRIVSRSQYGDYFDGNSRVTWLDVEAPYESRNTIIDFGRYRLELEYNMDLHSQWQKDFKKTTYLGGSIQGDWGPAVGRSGSVGTVVVPVLDPEQLKNIRRLAAYTGPCHIRTPDGSSFWADIQVTEDRNHGDGGLIAACSLSITRVDPQELDGELVEED